IAGERRGGERLATGINVLRNAGTAHTENRDAVLSSADGRDTRVQLMLVLSPINDIHGGHDQRLCAQAYQPVRNAGIAKVGTDTDADFAPRRIPELLFPRGQAVFEELDGHALDLTKHDVAGRTDDEGGVEELGMFVEFLHHAKAAFVIRVVLVSR